MSNNKEYPLYNNHDKCPSARYVGGVSRYLCECETPVECEGVRTLEELEQQLKIYVKMVKNATHQNNHCGALKLIAAYVKKKHKLMPDIHKISKCMDAIITLHDFYKYMPENLMQIRQDIKVAIFSLLDNEETEAFNHVL